MRRRISRTNPFKSISIIWFLTLVLVVFFGLSQVFSQSETTEAFPEENIFQSSLNLHQWGAINSFHGLPSERVNAIAQTLDGFLWFATDNGLAKFDGRRVETMTFAGVSSRPILALKVDSLGTLWIGTKNGAFYRKDGLFFSIKETAKYSIRSIFLDSEKEEVLLINGNGVVFRAESNSTKKVERILNKSLPIRSVIRDGDETLFGTFNRGLIKLVRQEINPIITQPRPYFINVLAQDGKGRIWLGARSSRGNSGLFVSDGLPKLKGIGENLGTVNTISFGGSGRAWVGTESRGAYLFEGQEFRKRFTFENTSGGLRSNRILATFVDREGVVWFGTNKGVSRYDPKSLRNERVSDDVQSNFIRTLFKTKNGRILAGTNLGLFLYDEIGKNWKIVEGFEKSRIYSIFEDEDGAVLVGTPKGMSSVAYLPESPLIKKSSEEQNIRAIAPFQKDLLLASSGKGVIKLIQDDERLVLETDAITLYNENDKLLWIGTVKKGVFVYDGKNALQKEELDELKGTAIRSIAGNEKEGIWFATDKGLYLFKSGKLDIVLTEKNIRKVVVQTDANGNSRIWSAAENGLFHITSTKHFGWISTRIDIERGLASQNVFAILPLEKDSFLIGTNRGLVRYDKTSIRPLVTPSRILSQRVHQPRELETGIDLDYPQNSLSIEVAAISSRTFPEQFQYSYLLFDSNNEVIKKSFSGDAQVLLDKLAPDKYRIEIRAYGRDLVVSQPLIFSFTVEKAPFPWIATILGVLLVIAIAALIWATLSQRKIFRTSKELTHANKELNSARLDLANEAERERHRISRDLHDQTLADLRHLILMSDEMPKDKVPDFRNEIENVSDEIRRICEDLSPSVLENIGFTAALEWALSSAVEQVSSDIKHEFSCDEDLEETLNLSRPEQIQIYRIAQEVLSNIVRHSDATRISLSVTKPIDGEVVLEIKDDSSGFDSENIEKGRGLSNIRARASLIEANVSWGELSERGMEFRLVK